MDGTVLLGFLKVIGISLVPVALFGAALHARAFIEQCTVWGRRVHLLPTPAQVPTGPPLEKLAADLRRLRPWPGRRYPECRWPGSEASSLPTTTC